MSDQSAFLTIGQLKALVNHPDCRDGDIVLLGQIQEVGPNAGIVTTVPAESALVDLSGRLVVFQSRRTWALPPVFTCWEPRHAQRLRVTFTQKSTDCGLFSAAVFTDESAQFMEIDTVTDVFAKIRFLDPQSIVSIP